MDQLNLDGKIRLSFDRYEGMKIEIVDNNSRKVFVSASIASENVSAAMSGMARIPCQFNALNTDKVGKFCFNCVLEFKVPPSETKDANRKVLALQQAIKICPEGWIPDKHYGSKDSFFVRNGVEWARTVIRHYSTEQSEPELPEAGDGWKVLRHQ